MLHRRVIPPQMSGFDTNHVYASPYFGSGMFDPDKADPAKRSFLCLGKQGVNQVETNYTHKIKAVLSRAAFSIGLFKRTGYL